MDRRETLNLFFSHAPALHIALLRAYSTYGLEVEITGQSYRALVLSHSSEFWIQRIHLHRTRPDLVICFTHDTCIPCAALDLSEGFMYEACELPHWYAPEKRFTARGHMVLLGQLLSGVEAGFQQLEQLPRSTRYRYLARMKRFMQNRAGRPLVA
jgi:hypothetical protein